MFECPTQVRIPVWRYASPLLCSKSANITVWITRVRPAKAVSTLPFYRAHWVTCHRQIHALNLLALESIRPTLLLYFSDPASVSPRQWLSTYLTRTPGGKALESALYLDPKYMLSMEGSTRAFQYRVFY